MDPRTPEEELEDLIDDEGPVGEASAVAMPPPVLVQLWPSPAPQEGAVTSGGAEPALCAPVEFPRALRG